MNTSVGSALLLALLPLALAACGGGGSSATSDTNLGAGGTSTTSSSGSSGGNSACDTLDKRIRTTSLNVGGNAAPNDEYTPAIITPRPDGSSVLAWTDSNPQRIRLAALNSGDKVTSSLPDLTGLEVHAALQTANGLALAVMDNDTDIYSAKYCRSASTPDKAVCGKMDLVRLDTAGKVLSRTTLTGKANVDTPEALFVWWYAHTARLATDGSRIGVYFRSAGNSPRPGVPGEIDIHAGDTFKFVNASSGALISGGWDWGCSHSWSVRLAYNGTQWGAACHGDGYPNAMSIARLASPTAAANTQVWLAETDPAQRALGGLVPASDGFWMNFIQSSGNGLSLQLAKIPASGGLTQQATISQATGLDTAYPFRPYMAAYGSGKLLLAWKAAGKLVLAVADAGSGRLLEGPLSTGLAIDNFQDIFTTSNGDVVWAHSRGGALIDVNRVAACKLGA